jgi:hypothetical protein
MIPLSSARTARAQVSTKSGTSQAAFEQADYTKAAMNYEGGSTEARRHKFKRKQIKGDKMFADLSSSLCLRCLGGYFPENELILHETTMRLHTFIQTFSPALCSQLFPARNLLTCSKRFARPHE